MYTQNTIKIWRENVNVHRKCLGFFGFVNKRQFVVMTYEALILSHFCLSSAVGYSVIILVFSSWSQSSFCSYNDQNDVTRHVATSVLLIRKTKPSQNPLQWCFMNVS